MHGTDISERSIKRARAEATRLGADLAFGVCRLQAPDPVVGDFDVVISCDNAIPHLLDDADVAQALHAMRAKLRPGGLLVISIRDYDKALIERPATAPPLLLAGPPRRLFVRLHDWDAPDSRLYTVRSSSSPRPRRGGRSHNTPRVTARSPRLRSPEPPTRRASAM